MKALFLSCMLFTAAAAKAQFKNDNVLYKNISPFELCATLEKSPGYLLLDVRSPGEYADTSSANYNYGRFKNAVNVNIRELGKRIHELEAYKNKPVFVYCSHSQRSRRASKMLSDSGFTNINNINGGITAFHYLAAIEKSDCLEKLYTTSNSYTLISPWELCKKISNGSSLVFLLDVRTDSAFKHISTDEKENALGVITGSVNIPLKQLKDNLSSIPVDKEIVLLDMYGHDADAAARILWGNGYKKVSVLTEGIDRWVAMDETMVPCRNTAYKTTVPYNLLPVTEFGMWQKNKKEHVLVDVRPDDEYFNRHKEGYRNIGHLKNALHIPVTDIDKRLAELEQYKNDAIVLYGFGGGSEVFATAAGLTKKGFTKLHVLVDGIFAVRWTAGNIDGFDWMKALLEDVPEENR